MIDILCEHNDVNRHSCGGKIKRENNVNTRRHQLSPSVIHKPTPHTHVLYVLEWGGRQVNPPGFPLIGTRPFSRCVRFICKFTWHGDPLLIIIIVYTK